MGVGEIHRLRDGARLSKEDAVGQSQKGIKAASKIARAKRNGILSDQKKTKTEIFILMRMNVAGASNIFTLMVNCDLRDHLAA